MSVVRLEGYEPPSSGLNPALSVLSYRRKLPLPLSFV